MFIDLTAHLQARKMPEIESEVIWVGRPAKSINVKSRKISKEEKKELKETEDKFKGKNDKIIPAKHLNRRQKEIFKYIVKELECKDILGNLDIFVLNQTAIVTERLEKLDKEANASLETIQSTAFKNTRDMYTKDFFRCCNELCLSPQSRAKIASASITPTKKASLMDILGGDDDDD